MTHITFAYDCPIHSPMTVQLFSHTNSQISHRWRGPAHSTQATSSSHTTNSYPGAPQVTRPYINNTAGPSSMPRYDPFAPPPRNPPTLPMTTSSSHSTAPATVPRPRIPAFLLLK